MNIFDFPWRLDKVKSEVQSVGIREYCIFTTVHFFNKYSWQLNSFQSVLCIFLMEDDMYLHKNSQAHLIIYYKLK